MSSGIDHQKSSELNGLSSSKAVNGINRPVIIDRKPHIWTNAPIVIPKPTTSEPHMHAQTKVNTVFNPHSRKQADTIETSRNNHVARRTLTSMSVDQQVTKRRKTEHPTMLQSKYFSGPDSESYQYYNSGSTNTKNTGRSNDTVRPVVGSVQSVVDRIETASRANGVSLRSAVSPFPLKGKSPDRSRVKSSLNGANNATLHAATKYIDLVEIDEDIGVPVAGPSRISNPSSSSSAKGRRQAYERLAVQEPNERHAFCQERIRQRSLPEAWLPQSPPLTSSRIARDGDSAKRLRRTLGPHTQSREDAVATKPRKGAMIQPPDDDSDVEEIESVSDTREVLRSTEVKAIPNTTRSKDFATPGAQLPFKPPSREPTGSRYISDLLKLNPIPKLKSKGMKLKGVKPSPSAKARKRDSAAKLSSYFDAPLRIPVLSCVWGDDVIYCGDEKDDHSVWDSPSAKPPRYWLYWERESPQLYLALRNGEDSERRLILENIRGVIITVSNEASVPFLNIDLRSQHGLPDEIRDNGICFKFLAGHPDSISQYSDLRTFFIDVVGAKSEGVIARAALSCFEAKEQSANYMKARNINGGKKDVSSLAENRRLRQNAKRRSPEESRRKELSPLPVNESQESNRLQEKERAAPPENSTEIILVYPPSGPGGVHVTRGDLARLREEEFLNDTLIELGFKFWMDEVRTQDPELAEQVHIFSPFFFKKLSNKSNKTPEDQHRSVQKWTAKVDIFQKQFIVVPVNENFHWYVMIVYKPTFILEPAPPKPAPPPPRVSKRKRNPFSKMMLPMDVDVTTSDNGKVGTTQSSTPDTIVDVDERAVEVELMAADAEVQDQLEACSLETRTPPTHVERELSTSGDDFPLTISDLSARDGINVLDLADDEEPIPGQLEGGGPSTKAIEIGSDVEMVDDSLEEDDDNQVDELEDNDIPTVTQATSTSQGVSELHYTSHAESRQNPPSRTLDADTTVECFTDLQADNLLSRAYSPNERAQADELDDLEVIEHIDTQVDAEDMAPKASSAVTTNRFYGTGHRTYANRKNTTARGDVSSDGDELNLFQDERRDEPVKRRPQEEPIEIDITEFDLEPKRTYVFSLDSMTTAHPKACGQISTYLMNEAKARKGVDNPSEAVCKKLHVSAQPNFSDCGLYLLHLTQIFLSNAEQLARLCSVGKRKKTELAELWKDDRVKTMRGEMRERILRESETWLKEKAEKEKKAVAAEKDATGAESNEALDKESIEKHDAQVASASPAQKGESDDEVEVSEIHYANGRPARNRTQAKKTPSRSAPSRLR